MIRKVTFEKPNINVLPISLKQVRRILPMSLFGRGIDYLNAVGMDNIAAYEAELLAYATEKAQKIKGFELLVKPSIKVQFCLLCWIKYTRTI